MSYIFCMLINNPKIINNNEQVKAQKNTKDNPKETSKNLNLKLPLGVFKSPSLFFSVNPLFPIEHLIL